MTIKQKEATEKVAKDPDARSRARLRAFALQAQEKKDWESAISYWTSLVGLYPNNADLQFSLGYSYSMFSEEKEDQEKFKVLDKAIERYQKATELNKSDYTAYYNWGTALFEQAKTKEGEEADRLNNMAYEKYSNAVKIEPDFHEAYYNWGFTLYNQAKTKKGEEADRLYEMTYEKYEHALKVNDHRQRRWLE